jgi:hypothetical protein
MLSEAGSGRSTCIADVQLAQTEMAVVKCTHSLSQLTSLLFCLSYCLRIIIQEGNE